MSFALLQSTLLLPLEALLNGLLALDAASHPRLAALDGKTLSVLATEPELALHISIGAGRLRLSPVFEGSATATLRGPARGLARLLLASEPPASFAPYGVELSGSTSFMQQLQVLLRDLDLDWEFHLSRVLGDLPASTLAAAVDMGNEFIGNTARTARRNIDEYLVHESDLFPARSDARHFASQLMELTLRLDRAEARVDLLMR